MRRAGLVASVRGPGGGYLLARRPEEISLGDIVRAVEGPIALLDCLRPTFAPGDCDRLSDCVARAVWKRLSKQFEGMLDEMTLSELQEEGVGRCSGRRAQG
jgi:Rrf2 family protein